MAKTVRFKCPFCEKRFTREDLVVHVEEEHEDLIPEEFTPLRYVFNYVNKKPLEYHGKCTECGGPTPWDENKGRYNRQCTNPRCKESFIKKFESNMIRTNGVTRISSTVEGQEKMLANRKISGTYKFKNGKEKTYTGNYELKALQFMDTVMNIDPDDILAPGPAIEYECDGVKHFYISDFYYIPYNLIIEVKDGGNRPNKRDMPEYRKKQIAKEKQIIKNTRYNYLRLTDNDFSQLLAVFMDLKMQLVDETQKRVIHINEDCIPVHENLIFNKKDLYKDIEKFESGKSNVLLITGFSGSGKSTLASELAKKYKCDYFELDCLDFYLGNYMTIENVKSGEPALYEFIQKKKLSQDKNLANLQLYEEYIKFLVQWCKKQKPKKFIIEGLQIYDVFDEESPQSFITSNPIIIKGTSGLVSAFRGAKRNSDFNEDSFLKEFKGLLRWIIRDNKKLKSLEKSVNEAMNALMSGYIPGADCKDSVFIVNYMQNNVFSGEEIRGYCISDDYKLENIIARNKEGILEHAPSNFLDNARYDVYMIKDVKESVVKKLAENMHKFVDESFIYESVFGHSMYTYDQIMLEESAIPVLDFNRAMELIGESTKNVLLGKSVCESMIISGTNASEIYNNFGIMESCFAIDENNISDPLERRFLEGLYYKEE